MSGDARMPGRWVCYWCRTRCYTLGSARSHDCAGALRRLLASAMAALVDRPPSGVHERGCEGFRDVRGRVEGVCRSWCWVHDRCEPVDWENHYRVCGECWHVYRTPDELLDEDERVRRAINAEEEGAPAGGRLASAEEVLSCPLCAHDF